MRRFFVGKEDVIKGEAGQGVSVELRGDEAAHIARVLRMRAGDQIVVCDGSGSEYTAELTYIDAKLARGRIVSEKQSNVEPKVRIALFQGLPKSDKMDLIVQKATELGVDAVYPTITERSVVRLQDDKMRARRARWERIAQEAAKQSGRAVFPHVGLVGPLEEVVAAKGKGFLLVPWEQSVQPLAKTLAEWIPKLATLEERERKIGVVIGPEGGLAASEVEALVALGAVPVSLGPRILRTETAGLATLAAILFACGEFGGQ